MNQGQNLTTAKCHFGDQRLTQRAVLIEEKLAVKYESHYPRCSQGQVN